MLLKRFQQQYKCCSFIHSKVRLFQLIRYWSQEKSQGGKQECADIPETIPSVEETFTICPPILTNVATRDGMAIVKIDSEAITHLRKLTRSKDNSDGKILPGFLVSSPLNWATTEAFALKLENLPKINASVKIFWDGCSGEEAGKFVSVFVEISDPEGKTLEGQFVVTLFLKNLKDGKGNPFKKSIKLLPSGPRVERGVRDFVPIEQFDKLLEEESIVSFGILVKQL